MITESLSVRVAGKHQAARDVVSLELVDPDGGPLPEFSPGAHIDVHLPGGYIRQYSLLNDCLQRSRFLIGVLREPRSRGGSAAVHDLVQVGDLLRISAPRNRFPLVAAERSLLFAGGIGITPLLCMARRLQATGAAFELHYSCRSRDRAAFLDEILDSALAGHVRAHFDDEPDTALDARAVLAAADARTHVYVCGPSGYIDFVRDQARDAGVDEARVHFERFALDEDQRPAAPAEGDTAFQVQLASTGEVFDIPADETITSALDRQGVFIPVSCEEGICGTCLTGVRAGIPDHRDSYLTEAEHAANDQFTPCCSRARTPLLVLDL
ncbi:PDR/VanB family oxidoreductase [Castellaniella defragrans]|uniref:PDR/VanB family oxidoreductase n=1 Tax=Castellaniella defragrans TaxID=75697 RepID=UPI0023F0FE58|nr:PDR/VanB family oxidoreductase [Castellaniella defragrans]